MKRLALLALLAGALLIAGGAIAAVLADSVSSPFSFHIDQTVTNSDGSTAHLSGDLTVDATITTPPPPPPDVCPNLDGVQSVVPDGYQVDADGNCVPIPPPPADVCPNIAGTQETIPDGMVKDANGNCVTPPPPSGNTLTVNDRTYVCSGPVNYDLVKVTISNPSLGRTDAVRIASGCTGRIGRLEVDTNNADGIHVGAGAHDLVIGSGYVHSSGVCGGCGSVHVDGIQVLGGQRITMTLDVNYPTATNSALYINQGSGGQDRPTDVVCDGCTFRRSPDKNRVVRIGDSLRSGIRNSTVYWCGTGPTCDAPTAPAIWFNGLQTDPVNENNTLIAVG